MTDESPRVLFTQRLFEGKVFNVRRDQIAYEDGARHLIEVVEHGGSFAVVATTGAGELVLVRQYRHPVGRYLWELPAGSAQPGEDVLAGAARELREETGYRAASTRRIGSLFATPGFCDEVMHFVLAQELQAGEQALDDDERIQVATMTPQAAWGLVASGEIADMKTLLALLWMQSGRTEIARDFGR